MKIRRLPLAAAGVIVALAFSLVPVFAGEPTEEPAPVPLFEAMAKKAVHFEAIAMHGFEKIDITLSNTTGAPLRVDPAGAVLLPPDPALQRLGLGAPVDADPDDPASFFIPLKPKGVWSGTVWAVCLDAEKGVPPSGVPYKLSDKPAPSKALAILRYWARKPGLSQKTVNDLIWTGQDLHVLKTQVIPAWLRKSTIACWGDALFWLSGEGTLHRFNGSDWEDFGSGLHRVSTAYGQVVGVHGSINGIRLRSLTGEGWNFAMLPGVPDQVLPAPGFVIYAVVENHLLKIEPGKREPAEVAEIEVSSIALGGAPGATVLYLLEKETGKIFSIGKEGAPREYSALPARGITATRDHLYGLFATGVFRFKLGKWMKVAEEADSVLPSSEGCFILHGDDLEFYSEKTGKLTALPALDVPALSMVSDPAGRRLWVLNESGDILVLEEDGWKKFSAVHEK